MRWFKNSKDKSNKTDQDEPVITSEDKPVDAEQAKNDKPVNNGDKPVDDGTGDTPKGEYNAVATGDHDGTGDDAKAGDDADRHETTSNTAGAGASPSTVDGTGAPASTGNAPLSNNADSKTTAKAIRKARSFRNGVLLFVAIAFVLNVMSTVNLARRSYGDDSGDLQADASMIVESINEKAIAHQTAVVALLDKTEKPSDAQLGKLGGWKLSWRQYVKKGKLYGEVKNVEGPNDGTRTVWSGKLKSAKTVKFTVSTSVDNAKNGTATDNLTTYSYAVVGRIPPTARQLGEAKTKYEKKMVEENADSIVMFTSGDDDARAVMLKAQGDGKYSGGLSASSGLVDSARPMRSDLAG